jgi:hypothetical protein
MESWRAGRMSSPSVPFATVQVNFQVRRAPLCCAACIAYARVMLDRIHKSIHAKVVKLVDTLGLGSSIYYVGVQVHD